jgi:cell division septal protein FtsQ
MSLRGRRRRTPAGRGVAARRARSGAARGRDLAPPREHGRDRAPGRSRAKTAAPGLARRLALPSIALPARPAVRIAILVLEVVGMTLLVNQPAFAAQRIDVNGAKHLTRGHILDRAGLSTGTSIFMISTSAAESKLAGDPYVRTVSVRTQLPNQVTIQVTEWEAVALVTQGQDHYLLNQEGNVLGVGTDAGTDGGSGQPRLAITQEVQGGLKPGQNAIKSRLLADLDHMQATFPAAYGLAVNRFVVQAGGQMVVETTGGPRILFGQMVTDEQIDSLDPKLAALKSLSGQVDLAHSRLDYITLENPNAPATHTIPSPLPSPRPSAAPTKKP